MIGIIGAMQIETEEIRKQMTATTEEVIAGTAFVTGTLWGEPAVVATSGPGKVFAAIACEIIILRYHPRYVVNVGVAGTLTPALHIGDLAIATATVQHDMDTSLLGDPVGLVSKINVTYFPCDRVLVEKAAAAAERAGIRYARGVIATGDRFIGDEHTKRIIVERFGAIACEMEGGAVGHTAYVNDVPYLVLRAMSDEADGAAPDNFVEFASRSAANTVTILHEMLTCTE